MLFRSGKVDNRDDVSKGSIKEKDHSVTTDETAISENKPNENDEQKNKEGGLVADNLDHETETDINNSFLSDVEENRDFTDFENLPGLTDGVLPDSGEIGIYDEIASTFSEGQVAGAELPVDELAETFDGEAEGVQNSNEVNISGGENLEFIEENSSSEKLAGNEIDETTENAISSGLPSDGDEMTQAGEEVNITVSNEEEMLDEKGGKKGKDVSSEKYQDKYATHNNTVLDEKGVKAEKPVTGDALASNNDHLETEIDLDIDLSNQGGSSDGNDETAAYKLQGDNHGAKNSSNDINIKESSGNRETKNGYMRVTDAVLSKNDNSVSKLVLNPEKGEIKIELNQSTLGRLKVELSIENSQLQAVFHADSPESKSVLEAGMQDFKESLDKQGLDLTGFDVFSDSDEKESKNNEEVNSKKTANADAGLETGIADGEIGRAHV